MSILGTIKKKATALAKKVASFASGSNKKSGSSGSSPTKIDLNKVNATAKVYSTNAYNNTSMANSTPQTRSGSIFTQKQNTYGTVNPATVVFGKETPIKIGGSARNPSRSGINFTSSGSSEATALQDNIGTVADRIAGMNSVDGFSSSGGAVNMSGGSPTVYSPGVAVAGAAGDGTFNDYAAKQLEAANKLDEDAQKENQTLMDKILGKRPELNPNQEAREDAWDDLGVDPAEYLAEQNKYIKEIDTLNNQYATVEAAKNQQIAQSNDKLASMNFINNQVQQIERNAAPQLNYLASMINAKAATMKALQGNFAEARSLVNEAVDAAMADKKYRLDMYQMLASENKDYYNNLKGNLKDSYDKGWEIMKIDYERAYDEKQKVADLFLDYANTGIDIYKDSYEEALQKVQRSGFIKQGKSGDDGISTKPSFAEYLMAQSAGFRSVGYNGPIPQDVIDSAAEEYERRYGGVSAGSHFSDTQLANGAAAAGMSISVFSGLSRDYANEFVNGASSSLVGGTLATKQLDALKEKIKEYYLVDEEDPELIRQSIEAKNLPIETELDALLYLDSLIK